MLEVKRSRKRPAMENLGQIQFVKKRTMATCKGRRKLFALQERGTDFEQTRN
jgi:hypothetical protein